jgi:hypothetical protein
MKKVYAFTSLFAAAVLIVSCGSAETTGNTEEPVKPTYDELHQASWLIGRWENTSEEGSLSEIWTEVNDSTYQANTYFAIPTGDTVFTEEIQLHQSGKHVWYSTKVSDQNDGKAVDFNMTKVSDKEIVFENKEHDYPQKIHYKLDGKTVTATISGKEGGKAKKEDFVMTKK